MESLDSVLSRLADRYGMAQSAKPETEAAPQPTTNPTRSWTRDDFLEMTASRSERWRAHHIGLDESSIKAGRLARTVEGFVKRALANDTSKGRWLVLVGPTGCGKSHASRRSVEAFTVYGVDALTSGQWRGNKVPGAVFVDWSRTVSAKTVDEWEDRMSEILRSQFVVLDDIGTEPDPFKSGEPTERLRQLLNQLESRWLIISTNVPKADWQGRWDHRVASRLSAGLALNLEGAEDYRLRKSRVAV